MDDEKHDDAERAERDTRRSEEAHWRVAEAGAESDSAPEEIPQRGEDDDDGGGGGGGGGGDENDWENEGGA